MFRIGIYRIIVFILFVGLQISCDSTLEEVITDNDSYSTTGISKIKIENYVNRLFIDIIGREPTDIEQSIEVDSINENDLSEESRLDLIYRLMTDTTFSINEGSYHEAYCNNLYLLAKIRCLDGIPDAEFIQDINIFKMGLYQDSLDQNWESYYGKLNQIRRLELVVSSVKRLQTYELAYHEMFGFMIDNSIYDILNMNTFNFVRASFDQLLFRIPTEQEYVQAFEMVESGKPSELLGETGNSKDDYIKIMINSTAMKEGMIRWAFQVFLQRPGSPSEIATLLEEYKIHEDINQIIAKIVVTDEYANFY
jgi:hypothetical protein